LQPFPFHDVLPNKNYSGKQAIHMLELYYGLLIFGVIAALLSILFGDLLSDALDGLLEAVPGGHLPVFEPLVLFGGLTVLGGAGVLLTKYSPINEPYVLMLSLIIAVIESVLVYFFYIKPMEKAENSIGFSEKDLVGQIAEVSIPVPSSGYGEVILRIVGASSNQIAASFDQCDIEAGAKVVVVEVKDRILHVSRLDDNLFQ
jgi:membrane protein implicated in regulation of membrane protease activity